VFARWREERLVARSETEAEDAESAVLFRVFCVWHLVRGRFGGYFRACSWCCLSVGGGGGEGHQAVRHFTAIVGAKVVLDVWSTVPDRASVSVAAMLVNRETVLEVSSV
jgi:hypothetical protein